MLKYYFNEKKEKVYTLKDEHNNKPTQEAHYKFIKIKDVKESQEQQSLNNQFL